MPNKQAEKPFVQAGEPLNEFLRSFWQRQINAAENETMDYKHPVLPLARIKKVMKMDPDVKMISADAPILLCKACEIFISEITARTFIISDSNKRRTLSRSDIATALSKSDQFDFLLDIVPRDIGGMRRRELGDGAGPSAGGTSSSMAAGPSGFNGGSGDTGMGQTGSGSGAGNKVDGLQDLQAFNEQTGGEDQGGMRRTGDGSGDVLKELEYLLDKPARVSAAVPSDVVRLS